MSRDSVKMSVTALLGANSDEQYGEHRRLYERLVERVTEVVSDPEFEPIDPFVQGTGLSR